nr:MAG TPA: hypothetical protein [Caudoviricetes sp.]
MKLRLYSFSRQRKTYSSCYLKYATEIVLLKLIAVVNNTSPVSSPAL